MGGMHWLARPMGRHRPRGPGLAAALVALMAAAHAGAAAGQSAVLQGQIVDEATLQPLAGVSVMVGDGEAGSLTNQEGRFIIRRLDPGVVVVRAEIIGYATALETDVVLQSSRPTFLEIRMRQQAIELEGIRVGAGAFSLPEEAPVSIQVLSNEELRRTPGGLLDVSRTLLSLPGVLGGVDNRNDLLVRGGGPGENAYYLDGIRIPQINHFATQGASGGALGLVNVDFIREVEFFTGAFPVRYGDALSSVLSIQNRPGSPEHVQGDFTLGATEAALTLDGPAGEDASWLFSLRRSYLQFLFAALDLPIRPDYWDAQLRFQADPTPEDRIVVVGLGAIDDFGIVPPSPDGSFANQELARRVIDNDQDSFTLGSTWRRLIDDGFLVTSISHSLTDFIFSDDGDDGAPVLENRSTEQVTRVGFEADYAPGDGRLRLVAGLSADRASLDARLFQRAVPGGTLTQDLAWDETLTTWKLGAFAQATRGIGARGSVTAGVRVDEVTALDQGFSVSPRLSTRWELGAGFSAQASTGVFHQAPTLLSMAVRENGRRVNTDLGQLRNRQLAGGLAWRATDGLRLSVEGFWKEYDHVPLVRDDPRIALPNLGGDYGFVGAVPLVGGGTGRARGVELFAQQKLLDSFYLLGAYTLSWSEYAGADGRLRPSAWDRRHALDLTGGWRPDDAWEFGSRLRFLSGLAITPWDIPASEETYPITGRGVPDWGRLGELRAPPYARLDLRAERRFSFTGWNAVVYLDIQNVLNRTNIAGFLYTEDPEYPDRRRPIQEVGFLPTFGFSVEF